MRYQRGSLTKHERLKQLILAHPELLGIEAARIVRTETEFPLLKKKRPIAQPDIMIQYAAGRELRRLFVEVKSGSCWYARSKLEAQVRKVSRFLRSKKITGEVLGVYCEGDVNRLCIVQ